MTSERVRAFLGVYMPLILGSLVIAFAVNFLARTSETPSNWEPGFGSWDVWRSSCAGALIFIGIVLGISTVGRYRKTKAARAGDPKTPP